MIALLLAACLAQISAGDMEWDRIQVEYIAQAVKVRSLEEVLPRPQAALIRLLGNPDYDVRHLARRELERMGREAHAALCWGMRVGDPTIAHTAALVRAKLFICTNCGGEGNCPECEFRRPGRSDCPAKCSYSRYCVECGGSGSLRLLRTYYGTLEELNLFPRRGK